MIKLRRVLFTIIIALLVPVLSHAHYINNPLPPPPDEIKGASEEILMVVSGFYAAVAGLETGNLRNVTSEFERLSNRLIATADQYEAYAGRIQNGKPIQMGKLPTGMQEMVRRTFGANNANSRILGIQLVEPRNEGQLFGQTAIVLRAVSKRMRQQSGRMTDMPGVDGLRQFTNLNSVVVRAVHIMALHSVLLLTTN